MLSHQRNWAGNLRYGSDRVHLPETIEEVSRIVRQHQQLKVLGSRHSFNTIADSSDAFISLERLDRVVKLDPHRQTVTIQAGMKYGQLGEYLHQHGFALANLASLPHISVAGAVATATHGSGENNGNLATSVAAMELVTAGGQIIEISRENNGEQFQGSVVHLGALAVITQITLDLQPTFFIRQDVYRNLPFSELEKHFDTIQASAYSVSLFTDWQSDSINQVWLKRRCGNHDQSVAAGMFFGATLAKTDLHPIETISAEHCTPQQGMPGPWHQRLPHFRMGYTPSSGEELQAEYFVPRENAVAAFREIAKLRNELAPVLLISELRTVAADALWMSPCYHRPSVTIHFTLKQDQPRVEHLLKTIETRLEPFNARPHWGKLFAMSASRLQSQYERTGDFQKLLLEYDPHGKFRNRFLKEYLLNP